MPTSLYRHFDAAGKLLYVGISLHPIARLSQHADKSWVENIAKVTIEYFDQRTEAQRAEVKAILSEKPKHNIQHAVARKPQPRIPKRSVPNIRQKSIAVPALERCFAPIVKLANDFTEAELLEAVTTVKGIMATNDIDWTGRLGYVDEPLGLR